MANPTETGKDAEVSVNGQTIVYTTTSYTINYETDSSDMNDSPTPTTAIYSRYMDGSLEWDGSQIEAHSVFINSDGSQVEDISLRISDTEKTYRVTDVTLESLDGDKPSDGKSSGTIEWRGDNFRRE